MTNQKPRTQPIGQAWIRKTNTGGYIQLKTNFGMFFLIPVSSKVNPRDCDFIVLEPRRNRPKKVVKNYQYK